MSGLQATVEQLGNRATVADLLPDGLSTPATDSMRTGANGGIASAVGNIEKTLAPHW